LIPIFGLTFYANIVKLLSGFSTTKNPLLSGYTVMELVQGCRTKREISALDTLLSSCTILWLNEQSAFATLQTFKDVHTRNNIDIIDVFIAFVALQEHLPLHTFNRKHFKAVPNLITIQPYKK
jgi:predicted nucleic acid-binding protein